MSPEYILALTYDLLAMRFTNGRTNQFLHDTLYGKTRTKHEPKKKTRSYNSPEAFERARRKAIGIDEWQGQT